MGFEMSKLKSIADKCKHYRREVIKISLKEMGRETDTYFKTLSAFENGRSTNLIHLFKYTDMGNEEQRLKFCNEIMEIIRDKK